MNKVTLIGFIGKDAELRYTTTGNAVADFSVATSESYKDKDGNKNEKTTWHNIVIFGKRAEGVTPFLKKGTRIAVVGKINNQTYDKADGTKGYSSKIVVSDIELLSKKDGKDGSDVEMDEEHTGDTDEIPF